MKLVSLRSAALAVASLATAASAQQDPPVPTHVDPVTTESGLTYSVLEKGGDGESPRIGDRVEVHYTGWLTSGKVFDSSRRRDKTSQFFLGQVIKGWNEGLALMTPGSRFLFTIPHDLAYGEAGRGGIPARATLVFDVELVSFEAKPRFQKPDPTKQKTLESGLKYEVLHEGAGDSPTSETPIEFHYACWNTSGVEINSSAFKGKVPRGLPSQFMFGVLQDGPLLMKEGSRYLFEVPPSQAFGDRDGGEFLPPNSTTIWELKLLRVLQPLPVPDFVMPEGRDLIATDSGLKYQVVKEGSGKSPRMGDEVKVNYAGWLTDGTMFDSSYGRGEASKFRLGGVIAGWNEGLQLMQPGAVYRFVIPPDLAYGERGSPPNIGPSATLVFHIELLD